MAATSANAGAVPMQLRGSANGFLPKEPISLAWVDEAMQPHWDRLSFELDGVDVTALVEKTAGGARIAMPMPLTAGEHELRVVYAAPDGSLEEWGRWPLHIAGEPVWRAQANSVLSLSSLALNSGALVAQAPRGAQSEAAAQVSVQREAEGFDLRASADLWVNTHRDANPTGNSADLGEYLVQADAGRAQLRLGHHSLDYRSLIYTDVMRRGLSGRMAFGQGSALSGFAMRSEPQVGASDLTGLSQANHRVAGVVLEHDWALGGGRGFSMSAAMVNGEGNDVEEPLQLGTSPLHRGQTWSVAGQASWNHDRVRAYAELAGSNYNWDNQAPMGSDKGRENDRAHAVSLDWMPEPVGDGSAWTLGFDHRVVGTFFRSVAYLGLPTDQVMNRVRIGWRSGPWSAAGSYLYQFTNANHLPDLPSVGSRQAETSFAWAPVPEGEAPWYGRPSLSLSLSQVRQRQRSTPANFVGIEADNRQWQSVLSALFDHGAWSTSVGVGRGGYSDASVPSLSTSSHTLSWGAHAFLGEHWTVGPQVEWSRLVTQAGQARQTERTASLFTDFAFIPDRFLGNLNIGVNLSRRTADSQRETNRFAVGELIWRLRTASLNSAGWDLRLSYSLQDFEDALDLTRSGRGNQVFLGVTMTLPAATRD
ncbi:MAG: hypothetical protein R3E42_05115 [Burkholderiaceae bacterium]